MIKIPKEEKSWTIYSNGTEKYIATSKTNDRSIYFLYKIEDEKLIKISKNKNPMEFDKIIYNIK